MLSIEGVLVSGVMPDDVASSFKNCIDRRAFVSPSQFLSSIGLGCDNVCKRSLCFEIALLNTIENFSCSLFFLGLFF